MEFFELIIHEQSEKKSFTFASSNTAKYMFKFSFKSESIYTVDKCLFYKAPNMATTWQFRVHAFRELCEICPTETRPLFVTQLIKRRRSLVWRLKKLFGIFEISQSAVECEAYSLTSKNVWIINFHLISNECGLDLQKLIKHEDSRGKGKTCKTW